MVDCHVAVGAHDVRPCYANDVGFMDLAVSTVKEQDGPRLSFGMVGANGVCGFGSNQLVSPINYERIIAVRPGVQDITRMSSCNDIQRVGSGVNINIHGAHSDVLEEVDCNKSKQLQLVLQSCGLISYDSEKALGNSHEDHAYVQSEQVVQVNNMGLE
ncbi:hypothetical protein RJT34_27125 [Clitoria ternatea]|uniref:Uncharacterized protein n=1 Tax=Clitoria ternatea TaxID=43366 RepID=A0AAN9I8E1_CLITE